MFEYGATEVHVRITAPPIMHPCFYGIDMASRKELAAARMSLKELEKYLGATSLGYLSVGGAMDAVGRPHSTFCNACFTGNYPVAVPEDQTKEAFEDAPHVGEIAAVSHGQLSLIEY